MVVRATGELKKAVLGGSGPFTGQLSMKTSLLVVVLHISTILHWLS